MKCVALFLAMLLALSGVGMASAAAPAFPEFVEGEPHTFTLDFKLYFETMTATQGACTIGIQKDIYERSEARTLAGLVMADLQTLSEATGIPLDAFREHTVYVVEKTPQGIQRFDNRVYCRPQDIESGAYRAELACAALGTEEYWKGVGLTGYAFGEKANKLALMAYYHTVGDLDILSLHIAYFLDGFSSGVEKSIARQTAISVCGYVVEHYGARALLDEDCIAYKQEWLKALGVDRAYDDPYYPYLVDYRYSSSAQYPLIATNSRGDVIYIAKMPDLHTPADVRAFLHDISASAEAILAAVAAQAPKYASKIEANYSSPFRVYCGFDRDYSYTTSFPREIHLSYAESFPHELGHLLAPNMREGNYYTGQTWQSEALCQYINYAIYPASAYKQIYFDILQTYAESGADHNEDIGQQYGTHVTEIYLKNAGMPASPSDLDEILFTKAAVVVQLLYPELKDVTSGRSFSEVYHNVGSATLRDTNGNELTYDQAFCFAT